MRPSCTRWATGTRPGQSTRWDTSHTSEGDTRTQAQTHTDTGAHIAIACPCTCQHRHSTGTCSRLPPYGGLLHLVHTLHLTMTKKHDLFRLCCLVQLLHNPTALTHSLTSLHTCAHTHTCTPYTQARPARRVHHCHQQHVWLQRDGGAGGVCEDQGAGARLPGSATRPHSRYFGGGLQGG